jgi:hypothetical protein
VLLLGELKMTEYNFKIHPLAALWPAIPPEQWEAFKAGIMAPVFQVSCPR